MSVRMEGTTTRIIAVFAIAIAVTTWGMDIFGIVGPCGYCRVQRSIIGILGFIILIPSIDHWLVQYIAKVFSAFGVVVAATQHFNAWNDISKGQFEFQWRLYENAFLLSGAALFIIVALILVIGSRANHQQTAHL